MENIIDKNVLVHHLAALPRLPYDEWLTIISGLKHEFGERETFQLLAAAGFRDEKPNETAYKIRHAKPKTTFGSVVHTLRQYGVNTDNLHTHSRTAWAASGVKPQFSAPRTPETRTATQSKTIFYDEQADERAAIYQYDGGLSREQAQRRVLAEIPNADARALPFSAICDPHREFFTQHSVQAPFFQHVERVTGCNPHRYWCLGARGNEVWFVHRDFTGTIRNVKSVWYTENGYNRDRQRSARYLYKRDDGYIVPFWSEEMLMAAENRDVIFVESEKTVLYAQSVFKKMVWLGCGGAMGCTPDKIKRVRHLLAESAVFVLFDNDDAGKRGAEVARRNIAACGLRCRSLQTSDFFPEVLDGEDVADVMVRHYAAREGGVL